MKPKPAGHGKRLPSKRLVLMMLSAIALLLLCFLVIGPSIFSSRMLADVYPHHAYNRGLKADDYVPQIPEKDLDGGKAVVLLREVHYTKFLRAAPVDWRCNNQYIPAAYQTNKPEEVRYIVYVNKYREGIGRYENGAPGARIDFYVCVIDRTTGEILGSQQFSGGRPPSEISSGSRGGVGSEPSKRAVLSWVSSVLP